MTTLQEQIESRMDSRPDKHTLAWWHEQFTEVAKGYRGLTHAVNLALAEIEDRDASVKKLQANSVVHLALIEQAEAKIGKLQGEVTQLAEAMEKARGAYAELKQKLR